MNYAPTGAPVLLNTRAVAKRLKVNPGTLSKWRIAGRGPAWLRFGPRLVRYPEEAIAAFIAASLRPTSEPQK